MPAEYSSLGSRPNLAFLKPLCKVAAIPAAIPADQKIDLVAHQNVECRGGGRHMDQRGKLDFSPVMCH